MKAGLISRLFAAFAIGAILVSVATAIFLDSARVRAVGELREVRHTLLLSALRQRLEVALSLGLDAQSLARLQVLAEAEVAADPSILSIDVFDDRGRLIFTTDAVGVGDTVPAEWVRAIARSERAGRDSNGLDVFRVSEESGLASGVPIVGDFGRVVGGLLLRRRVETEGGLARQVGLEHLVPAIGAGALGGGILALIATAALARRLDRLTSRLSEALAAEAHAAGSSATAPGLESAVAEMTAAIADIDRRCRVASAELERIDAQP